MCCNLNLLFWLVPENIKLSTLITKNGKFYRYIYIYAHINCSIFTWNFRRSAMALHATSFSVVNLPAKTAGCSKDSGLFGVSLSDHRKVDFSSSPSRSKVCKEMFYVQLTNYNKIKFIQPYQFLNVLIYKTVYIIKK